MSQLDFGRFANVATSIPFVLIGITGLLCFRRRPIDCAPVLYCTVALSFILVGLGSAFYHWSPSPARLLCDRLPIALALAAIAASVTDIPRKGLGLVLFGPAAAIAVLAVLYWYGTSVDGHADIRPWALVQVAIVIWIAVMALPAENPLAGAMRTILPVYAGGRICEFFEQPIYHHVGFDLGHPVKHLSVAWAAWLILRGLAPRHSPITF